MKLQKPKPGTQSQGPSLDKALRRNDVAIAAGARPPGELFDEVSDTIMRFMIMDKHQADAATLWIIATYLSKSFDTFPISLISAPERACGKSLLLTIFEKFVFSPLQCANISNAALFRTLDNQSPTLLIDEADTFVDGKPDLHGILNAGYARDGCVIRVEQVGDQFMERAFSVYGPKLLAGIALERHLPEATMSRGIVFTLRRKLKGEQVDRLRLADPDLFKRLRSDILRFAKDHNEMLKSGYPNMPDALSDRSQDNWEPLFAIAKCAGGGWIERVNQAAVAMSTAAESNQSTSNNVLADIRGVLEGYGRPTITSADLLSRLTLDPDMGWDAYNRGNPLTPRQLAKHLGVYGIKPKTVRMSATSTPKGYELAAFDDAFSRYLTPLQDSLAEADQAADPTGVAGVQITDAVQPDPDPGV